MSRNLWSWFGRHDDLRRYPPLDLWIILLLVATTVTWSALAGKDLNWDQLNYHFYVAYSLLNDRLGHDFMAANGQSVLNPLVYVPFYWMVKQHWSSLLIASTLAAIHSLNIVLAYAIAKTALPERSPAATLIAALGAVLAFLSPTFLMAVGTTFADITTSVLVLASMLIVLRAKPGRAFFAQLFFAGVLFGAAGGLKLSNLIFGPAFAGMLLWMHPSLKRSLHALLPWGLGALVGIVATHGYWSWLLWNEYGGSGVPTLGSLLGSPDIPPGPKLPQRFLPESFLEALALPFRMVQLTAWIYLESTAPDLRFAAVVATFVLAPVVYLARKRTPVESTASPTRVEQQAVAVFFLLALALWIVTSANGRYGLVVSILCGPVLAVLVRWVSRTNAIAVATLIGACALQTVLLQSAQLRWTSARWTDSWYQAHVPERLEREAYLYISVGGNSHSYVAPFLAPSSAFTNPIGQLSFDFDVPGGKRLAELIERYEGRTRVMARADQLDGEEAFHRWVRKVDTAIARLGFAVNPTDCLMITTEGAWQLGDAEKSDIDARNHLRTCSLIKKPYEHANERARVTGIARSIAAWCPSLFQPRRVVVEQAPYGWYVNFVSTDTTLLIKGNDVSIGQPRTSADIYLGTLEYWEGKERPSCAAIPIRMRKVYTFD